MNPPLCPWILKPESSLLQLHKNLDLKFSKKSCSSLPPHPSTEALKATTSSVSICNVKSTPSIFSCQNSTVTRSLSQYDSACKPSLHQCGRKQDSFCVLLYPNLPGSWKLMANSVDCVVISNESQIIGQHLASRSSSHLSALETTSVRSVCPTFSSSLLDQLTLFFFLQLLS